MKSNKFAAPFLVGWMASWFALSAIAGVQPLTLSSDTTLQAARWMYQTPMVPPSGAQQDPLALLKQAQMQNNPGECIKRGGAARAKAKALQPWIVTMQLECIGANLDQLKDRSDALKILGEVERKPELFIKGAQVPRLNTAFVNLELAIIDGDIKSDRNRAWRNIEMLSEMKNLLDDKQKASLYRSAGELSFIQQKLEAARQFFTRSLSESEAADVRARLNTVEASLTSNKPAPEATPAPPTAPSLVKSQNLEASDAELEAVTRITTSLKTGDFLSAVEDCVNLILQYPGGTRAKWATERVQESYATVVERAAGDPKYALLLDGMLKQMEKADGQRLTDWAHIAMTRAQYGDAYRLATKATQHLDDGATNLRAFETAAVSAVALERYADARVMYQQIVLKYAGTSQAREALLHSALIDYRNHDYKTAVTSLERLMALPQSEALEVVARYWMWRALQKSNSEQANPEADILISRFPFSYYGLRASIDRAGGKFNLLSTSNDPAVVKSTWWLTTPERAAYERALVLLKAGCLDEAQAEIRDLPPVRTPQDRVLRARMYASALAYVPAIDLINRAWDEDPSLRREPFIDYVFPREFSADISQQAQSRNLSPDLVRGLIKQESGYQIKAVSSSSAYGLMQMIPPTAKEIATVLKLGAIKIPDDLYNPARNIRMGTYYIGRLVTKFQGHIPLALAAYNAGPTRIDKWIKSRSSLKNLATTRTADPDDELWVDELPWSETSFYVKAILRNELVYMALNQKIDTVTFPIWAQSPQATSTTK